MAWNGNKAYAYSSPERNAAILLNWCNLNIKDIDGKKCVTATCQYTWKVPSKTSFQITRTFAITIHEELFYELEKAGWLHPYTLVCYTEIDKFYEK